MKFYKIDENFANNILRYLSKQPYEEVFNFIHGLQRLQETKEKNSNNVTTDTCNSQNTGYVPCNSSSKLKDEIKKEIEKGLKKGLVEKSILVQH
jgi:hypothetical protein